MACNTTSSPQDSNKERAVIHKQPRLAQKGSTETSIAGKSPLSADKPITSPNIESLEKDVTPETRACQAVIHKQPHLAQKVSTETSIARKSPLSADKPITSPNIESMEKDAVIHKQPRLAQKGSTETSIAGKSPLSADKPITSPNIESLEKDVTPETRACQ
ncbi:unnamed protein product, partial [Porites lobata]